MDLNLSGRVAVVTGGSKGIGLAVVRGLLQEGAQVVCASRTAPAADGVLHVPVDLMDPQAPHTVIAQAIETYGGVDVLVNNAGLIDVERHVLEGDEAWWDRVIAVNLKGQFLCALRAARWMAEHGGGAIVNLSSGGARAAHRGMVAYDASKGGVEAMTRALALDLAPYGIRVNAIAPGSIDVRGFTPEEAAKRGETVPLGRVGTPADMAGPAVFLASDDAAYVTGVAISVDGGLIAQQRSPQVDTFPPTRFPRLS